MPKLIILGLDGATWDILMPLLNEGRLKNLKRMVENGSYGNLISTIPPITSPAWVSMATGKNPGQLGVFDLLYRENEEELTLKPVYFYMFKGSFYWDFLSNMGYRVGLIFYPFLYPPYRINGIMVPGYGAPSEEKMYPSTLSDEIKKRFGEIKFMKGSPAGLSDEKAFKEIVSITKQHFEIGKYIIENNDLDVITFVISGTDWIQHFFWKFLDPTHALYDEKIATVYREKIFKFYEYIDEQIGDIIGMFPDSNFIIVSDHGFGSLDQYFNLVKWLIDNGYMVFKRKISGYSKFKNSILQFMSKINRRIPIVKIIPRSISKKAWATLKIDISEVLDLERTKAFCLGHHTSMGSIYVNKTLISNKKDVEKIKNDIKNGLIETLKRFGVENVKFYSKEDIYHGKKAHLAPDMWFSVNDGRCAIMQQRIDHPVLFENVPLEKRINGSHRFEGIFLAYGPDLAAKGNMGDLSIYDIAPTVLSFFGIPPPSDMDGKVIEEILPRGRVRNIKSVSARDLEKMRIKEKLRQMKQLKNV